MTPDSVGLLARAELGDLVFILFVLGIPIVRGIVKMINERTGSSDSEDEKTRNLIEMAKRYKAMQESGRAKMPIREETTARVAAPARPAGTLSEWDRRQLQKKQQLEHQQKQARRYPKYVDPMPQATQPTPPVPAAVKAAPVTPPPIRTPAARPKTPPRPRPRRDSQAMAETARRVVVQPAAKRARTAQPVRVKAPEVAATGHSYRRQLANKASLRAAFVLKEILDKPVGLREDG